MTNETCVLMQVGRSVALAQPYVIDAIPWVCCPFRSAASKVRLPEGSAKGKCVVILGAGIAAWSQPGNFRSWLRLHDLGGARPRWRRNWTIRNGTARRNDRRHDTKPAALRGSTLMQAGAFAVAKHVTMLGYCRELGVELEVEVNSSRSSLCRTINSTPAKPSSNGR